MTTNAPFIAGVLMDRHIEIIEHYSTHTRLVTNRLDYTVQTNGSDGRKPGRFLTVVAQYLLHGHEYTYFLPGPQSDWDVKIDHLGQLLAEAGADDAELLSRSLRFRFTDFPVAAGFVLMQLDLERLREEERLVHNAIVPDYSNAEHPGVLGEIIPGSSRTHGALLMDAAGIDWGVRAWKAYEATAIDERKKATLGISGAVRKGGAAMTGKREHVADPQLEGSKPEATHAERPSGLSGAVAPSRAVLQVRVEKMTLAGLDNVSLTAERGIP